MTTYNNLPVYQISYEFLVEIFLFSKNFSREYKFTLGEILKKETIQMMINVYRSNNSIVGRKEKIQVARENIEVIRLLLRLLKDLKQINLKKFVLLNEKIELISKQLSAWQKSSI